MNVVWPNGSTTPPQLNSPYGPRESFWTPGGWTNSFHYGQDCTGFSMNRSIADGVVVFVGYNGGYGNHVRVRHDDGYESSHSHGATGGFRVSVGQRVRAGDDLMVQGTTGRSTGVHDHLEVYLPNGDTIDPVRYIRDRLSGAASTGTTNQSWEDDMIALAIKDNAGTTHRATLGLGVFRHLLESDDVDWVKNVVTSDDNWTDCHIDRLPVLLKTYGCRTDIYRLQPDGNFAVRDTDTDTVISGGMWHR